MTRKRMSTSPFTHAAHTKTSGPNYTDGDRVTHDRHGLGRVVRVDTGFCVVSFGDDGYRRINLTDPKLEKL